jgi:hypothetical protein
MNKFKRILLASGLAATASLVANSPAFADTTGTVNLSGTVPSTLSLTVTPAANVGALQLTPGATYTGIKIATLSASSNAEAGLRVTASSPSDWLLLCVPYAYWIPITKLGEAATTSATSPAIVKDVVLAYPSPSYTLDTTKSDFRLTAAPDSSIFISYSVPNTAPSCTYTASITFTAYDN